MRRLPLLSFIVILILFTSFSYAENYGNCVLYGLVMDYSGNGIKDAVVQLTRSSDEPGVANTYTGVTNGNGWYVIDSFTAGTYNVKVEREGYIPAEDDTLRFSVFENKRKNYFLKPSSSKMTLIITNKSEFLKVHASSPLAYTLMEALPEIAEHPTILGDIIYIDEHEEISQAFETWKEYQFDPLYGNRYANMVCKRIKTEIQIRYLRNLPDRYKYIVIIGDDRIVPFYRIKIPDLNYGEENYLTNLSQESTIRTAFEGDYTLTDDYYGDLMDEPNKEKWDVYIPVIGVGRLVETPEEITASFLSYINTDNKFDSIGIYGSSYLKDLSIEIKNKSEGARWTYSIISDDEGDWAFWEDLLLSRKSDVLFMNLHANHYQLESPLSAFDVAELTSSGDSFEGSVIYAPGCHSGLCVPPENPNFDGYDLTQTLMSKGVLAYIGNTGYSFGYEYSIGLSERLAQIFFYKLENSRLMPVSEALRKAKIGYILESFRLDNRLDNYDRKILYEATLYGLPMAFIQNKVYFPKERVEFEPLTRKQTESQGDNLKYERIDIKFGPEGFKGRATKNGEFYSFRGFNTGKPYSFARPLFFVNWSKRAYERAKGSLLLNGKISKRRINPYLNVPMNEYYNDPKPLPSTDDWETPVLCKINTFEEDEALVIVPAMIEGIPGILNPVEPKTEKKTDNAYGNYYLYLFEEITIYVTFSKSEERGEDIELVISHSIENDLLEVTAKPATSDSDSIERIYFSCLKEPRENLGYLEWKSIEMRYDPGSREYVVSLDLNSEKTRAFILQSVNKEGRVFVHGKNGKWIPVIPPIVD